MFGLFKHRKQLRQQEQRELEALRQGIGARDNQIHALRDSIAQLSKKNELLARQLRQARGTGDGNAREQGRHESQFHRACKLMDKVADGVGMTSLGVLLKGDDTFLLCNVANDKQMLQAVVALIMALHDTNQEMLDDFNRMVASVNSVRQEAEREHAENDLLDKVREILKTHKNDGNDKQ